MSLRGSAFYWLSRLQLQVEQMRRKEPHLGLHRLRVLLRCADMSQDLMLVTCYLASMSHRTDVLFMPVCLDSHGCSPPKWDGRKAEEMLVFPVALR